MHRTLKHDATDPPQPNQRRQQRAFDVFRREYNEQRPHEALQMKPPATFYAASPRPYRSKLPELEYPPGHLLRRVSNIGVISCCGHRVFLTSVLAGEVVGLRERDAKWEVHFGPLLLGFVSKQQPETGLVPVPQDAGDL